MKKTWKVGHKLDVPVQVVAASGKEALEIYLAGEKSVKWDTLKEEEGEVFMVIVGQFWVLSQPAEKLWKLSATF